MRRVVTTPKNDRHWAQRDPDDFERAREWFAALEPSETARLAALLAKLQSGLRERVKANEPSRLGAAPKSKVPRRGRRGASDLP